MQVLPDKEGVAFKLMLHHTVSSWKVSTLLAAIVAAFFALEANNPAPWRLEKNAAS